MGLYAAGLLIESAAIDKTPKDLGNLRQSFYVAPDGSEIGNTADQRAVHEDLEAHHEVGEAKYLERAINENEDKILQKLQNLQRAVFNGYASGNCSKIYHD